MARRPEVVLTVAQRRRPERMARSAHAALREEWFIAVSQRKGSELLAVQTQRNSLMSATVTASTAMLVLIGTVTLVAPSLHASFGWSATLPSFTPRLVLELLLLTWGGRHKPVQVLRRPPPTGQFSFGLNITIPNAIGISLPRRSEQRQEARSNWTAISR